MTQKMLAEVVSQYLDASSHRAASYLHLIGGHREPEPLFGIVRLLRQVLVPVEPSPSFAADLKARLMTMPVESLPAASPYPSRLVIGAVAVGSVVSAAAAAYYVYSRSRVGRAA